MRMICFGASLAYEIPCLILRKDSGRTLRYPLERWLPAALPAAVAARRPPMERMIGSSHDDAAGEGGRESKGNQDNAKATHGGSFRNRESYVTEKIQ
jgi:hypothetical protein